VKISSPPEVKREKIKITSSAAHFGGVLYTVCHWSEAVDGFMNFNLYLPEANINKQRGRPFPSLYCLGGLGSTHENFSFKSGFGVYAKQHGLAVVFPDASPRNTNIQGVADDW
jgi:S-formylglutathione hydrolase